MKANERFGASSGSTIDTVDAHAALKTDCPEVSSRPGYGCTLSGLSVGGSVSGPPRSDHVGCGLLL